jgi:hypothetical protein
MTESQRQGRCVFCNDTGLTHQHIWPKWLKKINQPHVSSHVQIKASIAYTAKTPTPRTKTHHGHSGTRTARKVCKKCNNGWIERLEERVRDPVTRLMNDEPVSLDAAAQQDMAAWITLVTMMVEFTDLATQATPPEDYAFLRETGNPPPRWKVWIAGYSGHDHGSHVVRHLGLQLSEFPDVRVEPHKCDTQVTTFVIGHLCAHSFSSTVIDGTDGFDYVPIDLPQIWPSAGETIEWGSARQLTDRGVVSLAGALLRVIPPASGA